MFLYLDDGIQWTTGDASGGENGFGGTEAQVGYDAGDYINYYTVPGSLTPSIVDIETTSNVGIPGLYIFEVGTTSSGKIRHKWKCVSISKMYLSWGSPTVSQLLLSNPRNYI